MDYPRNTDKQTTEIRYDRTIKFLRWKSYLKIGIWLFNFLILTEEICFVRNFKWIL